MANNLKELSVNEISAVDRPANSETDPVTGKKVARAIVALWKRDDTMTDIDLWKAADGQMVNGKVFPRSDFAYTPSDNTSEWKLRLTATPGGTPDPGIVGAAAAALGPGFRGQKVQIPAADRAAVVARVRAAWHKANPDKSPDEMPDALKKGESMTLAEIEAKVTKQDETIAALTAESDLINKMGKKEFKAFGSMTPQKRKAYMAADADKRKAMMDECKQAMKAAKAKGAAPDGSDPDGDQSDQGDDKEARKAKKIMKGMTDQLSSAMTIIKKQGEQLDVIAKQNRLLHFQAMAEATLPNTPGTAVEKGEMLATMADGLGGETDAKFVKMFAELKRADQVLQNNHMAEIGKWGIVGKAAGESIESAAESISKRDKISLEKAYIRLSEEQPEIFQKLDGDAMALIAANPVLRHGTGR